MKRFGVLVVCVLAACSSSGAERSESPRRDANVNIEGLTFTPNVLEVRRGTTVTWSNDDAVAHTVTSGRAPQQGAPGVSPDRPASPDGIFDAQLSNAGATFSFTFADSGTFTYFCSIHAGMKGKVVVD